MPQILWQKYKSLERIFTLYSHKKNVVRKMATFLYNFEFERFVIRAKNLS